MAQKYLSPLARALFWPSIDLLCRPYNFNIISYGPLDEPFLKGWNADVVIVVAITDKNVEKQAYGISLFLVDTNLPGFKRGKLLKKIGMHTQDKISIIILINC